MTHTIYKTQVTAIGDLVPTFREAGMLVFFGANAPEELHDFCILHEVTHKEDVLRPGDVVTIGETSMTILAVGDVASDNQIGRAHV